MLEVLRASGCCGVRSVVIQLPPDAPLRSLQLDGCRQLSEVRLYVPCNFARVPGMCLVPVLAVHNHTPGLVSYLQLTLITSTLSCLLSGVRILCRWCWWPTGWRR